MEDNAESPRKRVKLTTEESQTSVVPKEVDTVVDEPKAPSNNGPISDVLPVDDASKEAEVGITGYLNSESSGFDGILKKRYTDFLVNEILLDGRVLHLESTKPPKMLKELEPSKPEAVPIQEEEKKANGDATASTEGNSSSEVSADDLATINSHFGEEVAAKVISLYAQILAHPERKSGQHPTVRSTEPITDRTLRTQIHQDIRRIFHSRLESSTSQDGFMLLSAATPQSRKLNNANSNARQSRQGKLGWQELGGEYLHFTIYKENKDTMEVVAYLARELKVKPKSFAFAGTKDRRGVTVQRACAYRVDAGRIANLNRTLRNAAVGDFTYEQRGLELGDLAGNEFIITLRDCELADSEFAGLTMAQKVAYAKESITRSMRSLRENGYFNYFGLQRFGTFASRTDAVGLALLKGDFERACNIILDFSPVSLAAAQSGEMDSRISSDDKARAEAIHIFQTTGKAHEALQKLPRKFGAESNLVRHLSKSRNDYAGAIMTIPRNLRMMYAHAYQSLVWNFAVGERWRLYGSKVVEGDLVMVDDHKDKVGGNGVSSKAAEKAALAEEEPEVDEDGEPIIRPLPTDTASSLDSMFARARALTAAEATSGQYTIFDIVLPLPGFDIIYPPNAMTQFYKDFMADPVRGGGLDPFDMRRKQRDFSLSGGYRKILSRIDEGFSVDVRSYRSGTDPQFVETDLEKLRKTKSTASSVPGETATDAHDDDDKIAVILNLKLGSSQYATMALRELTKGRVGQYKPDFGIARS